MTWLNKVQMVWLKVNILIPYIFPEVTYGCESWIMSELQKNLGQTRINILTFYKNWIKLACKQPHGLENEEFWPIKCHSGLKRPVMAPRKRRRGQQARGKHKKVHETWGWTQDIKGTLDKCTRQDTRFWRHIGQVHETWGGHKTLKTHWTIAWDRELARNPETLKHAMIRC